MAKSAFSPDIWVAVLAVIGMTAMAGPKLSRGKRVTLWIFRSGLAMTCIAELAVVRSDAQAWDLVAVSATGGLLVASAAAGLKKNTLGSGKRNVRRTLAFV